MKLGLLLLLLAAPPGPSGPAAGQRLLGRDGECPPPSRIPVGRCDNFCSSDENCPGSERCCSTGCGRECRLPIGAKRGFCPQAPDVVSICLVECSSDSQCRGNGKCCSIGCHVQCVQSVPAKSGVCPKRKVLQTFAPCNNSCTDDTDCPGRNKCCFTGCGLGCLSPDKATMAPLPRTGRHNHLDPAASDSPVSSPHICHLPPVHGPCRERYRRYAYNPAMGTCQPFIYSGCKGNPNNFEMVEECQKVCQQPGGAKE
ncbi:uncharacterized protein [Patagioenas fasciata]|uniref:uncharacterized protein n=1 Tax=Patagioenas fasciata TaxID=372321 RepID=UPI0032E8AA06